MPDAVLVPGGGLRGDGTLPPWTVPRLDCAIKVAGGAPIITLSAGTPHKPTLIGTDGRPLCESVVAAGYLIARGYPAARILTETASWDTIGNAYFARVIHTDPAGYRDLIVVTSAFHMPRTELVFRWIFGAAPSDYRLQFQTVANEGLSAASLRAREQREQSSIASQRARIAALTSLAAIHHWLFAEHEAYAAGLTPRRAGDPGVLESY